MTRMVKRVGLGTWCVGGEIGLRIRVELGTCYCDVAEQASHVSSTRVITWQNIPA